jgi:hypothetical protein
VRIGAILTLAGGQPSENYFRAVSAAERPYKRRIPAWDPRLDILGSSLLTRSVAKLNDVGVSSPTILRDRAGASHFLPLKSAKAAFLSQWENAVEEAVNRGVEQLFLLRVGVYSDLDYAELLDSHVQSGAVMTQGYAPDGSLDVAVVDTSLLKHSDGAYRKRLSALIPQQVRFDFHGYVNRLTGIRDFFQLVQDGLYNRCALYPIGNQIQEGIWLGDGAEIDSTAVISAPAFIGAGSQIGASCAIAGGCAIERNCKIDYATLIHESCVLQDSYIGMALDVRRAVVGGHKMFALNRNTEIKISDRRLLASNAKPNWLEGFASWLSREVQQAD